jgi:hypothetical protein
MRNILFLMLSDETGSSGTDIPDGVFEWWKGMVAANQDKIIVTVTHSHLAGSGFPYAILGYRNVRDSRRFEEVLARYRVDLWIDGHTHAPSSLGLNELRSKAYGTVFLNVASIRRDAPLGRVESRILVLEKGSDRLLILDRYHDEGRFAPERARNYRLSRAAEWTDKSIRMVPYREE